MPGIRKCYKPIDKLLEDWCFLVLRAARRFDWAESWELAVALNVPGSDVDHRRRNSFDMAIRRQTLRGYLERSGPTGSAQYRITQAGRAEYERQLRRSAA